MGSTLIAQVTQNARFSSHGRSHAAHRGGYSNTARDLNEVVVCMPSDRQSTDRSCVENRKKRSAQETSEWPSISEGCGRPINLSNVGATSQRRPLDSNCFPF